MKKYLFISIALFSISLVATVLSAMANRELFACAVAKDWALVGLCTIVPAALCFFVYFTKGS